MKKSRYTEEQVAYARQILAKPEQAEQYHNRERNYAERVLRLADSPAEVTVPLQTLRLGDLGIAAIPCETFVEIGLEFKQRSPQQPAFMVELAHGYLGYLPTPRHHDLGGYETWLGTNRLERTASEKLLRQLALEK